MPIRSLTTGSMVDKLDIGEPGELFKLLSVLFFSSWPPFRFVNFLKRLILLSKYLKLRVIHEKNLEISLNQVSLDLN